MAAPEKTGACARPRFHPTLHDAGRSTLCPFTDRANSPVKSERSGTTAATLRTHTDRTNTTSCKLATRLRIKSRYELALSRFVAGLLSLLVGPARGAAK